MLYLVKHGEMINARFIPLSFLYLCCVVLVQIMSFFFVDFSNDEKPVKSLYGYIHVVVW